MSEKISFCTTCKGRLQHLKETLPRNMKDNPGANVEFVVLDYNSGDGLEQWIKGNFGGEMKSGRLRYARFQEPEFFHMAHAKNMAHRIATGDILCNLDADNFTGPGFAKYISARFEEGGRIYLRPSRVSYKARHKGEWDTGMAGRIAVRREDFLNVGGYDEMFDTWSPDDKDFAQRLRNTGLLEVHIPAKYLGSIRHGDALRGQNYRKDRFKPKATPEARHSRHDFNLAGRHLLTFRNDGKVGTGCVYINNDATPTDIGPIPTRIFGIGWHKTGTTSLHRALEKLGFVSAHWAEGDVYGMYPEILAGRSRFSVVVRNHAVSDLPVSFLYKELDRAYPGSKFILTTRDEDSWLASARKHWAIGMRPARNDNLKAVWDVRSVRNYTHQIHTLAYGQTEFDEGVFAARFAQHNKDVLDYFRDRPQDLLVMDMSRGSGWDDLCAFLDVPAHRRPAEPYPHAYRTEERLQRMGLPVLATEEARMAALRG